MSTTTKTLLKNGLPTAQNPENRKLDFPTLPLFPEPKFDEVKQNSEWKTKKLKAQTLTHEGLLRVNEFCTIPSIGKSTHNLFI